MPLVQENTTYTYQDYLKWDDDERWEIINGIPYKFASAPATPHQRVSMRLSGIFENALKGKTCEAYAAPTDVIFSEENVVQPDLLVVCDKDKIKTRGIFGAPDLVIEIISPASSKRDRWDKKKLYERFGVKEFLLIETEGQYVEQYILNADAKYAEGKVYSIEDKITLQSLTDITLTLSEIFDSTEK